MKFMRSNLFVFTVVSSLAGVGAPGLAHAQAPASAPVVAPVTTADATAPGAQPAKEAPPNQPASAPATSSPGDSSTATVATPSATAPASTEDAAPIAPKPAPPSVVPNQLKDRGRRDRSWFYQPTPEGTEERPRVLQYSAYLRFGLRRRLRVSRRAALSRHTAALVLWRHRVGPGRLRGVHIWSAYLQIGQGVQSAGFVLGQFIFGATYRCMMA